jgi:hypothetical protein
MKLRDAAELDPPPDRLPPRRGMVLTGGVPPLATQLRNSQA